MSCFSGLARCLLIIINIGFMLLGLTLTILGLILRYGSVLYTPFLKVGMNELQEVLDKTNLASFKVEDIDLGEVMTSLAVGLIVGGLVLMGIAFVGCCGACCKFQFFLYVYALVIVIFIVGEAIAIGLLYGKPELVKDGLRETLADYKGIASSEVYTLGWNIIMIQFKCCGVDSYKDFESATNWNRTLTLLNVQSVTLETPVACCKTLPTDNTQQEFQCATTYQESTSNGETGCYDTLWNKSFANTAIVVPVLVLCGIIQVLFIIFAVSVAKNEDKVSPI